MPTITTNDIETYYERHGSGPPVVFIHGAIVDLRHASPQFDALSDEYTAIAYDVRGHGRTGGSSRASYSIRLFVEDLHALITGLELDRPVLCGFSTGGCIAQVYAATYPDRIGGLVLADTFTPAISGVLERAQMAVLRSTILPVRFIGYERVEKIMLWFHEQINRGSSGEYENIERLRATGPKMDSSEFAKVIRALTAFSQYDIEFSSITVPALVIYGENEPRFIHRHAGILGESLPNAELKMIPGAGHAANLDNPDCFTTTVRAFLEETTHRTQSVSAQSGPHTQ